MDWEGIDAHWAWLTLGLVLAALEMLVPGIYLMWIAIAALITGVLTYLFDPPQAMETLSRFETEWGGDIETRMAAQAVAWKAARAAQPPAEASASSGDPAA